MGEKSGENALFSIVAALAVSIKADPKEVAKLCFTENEKVKAWLKDMTIASIEEIAKKS